MNPTIELARQNFTSALADDASHLPSAGLRWATFASWCREKIPTFETPRDAVHFAQQPLGHGGFESRHRGDDLLKHADAQELRLEKDFPDYRQHAASFNEPDFCDEESTAIVHGRRVSKPLYAHTSFFFTVAKHVPRTEIVCEIGGGYGAPARVYLTNTFRPASRYFIVDLPESLFFAECYLREALGSEHVHYLDGAVASIPHSAHAILCPITRIECLKEMRFDLVVNTLSMQEMSDEYIAFYRDWLDRQPVDHFFSFNYFAQDIRHRNESSNFYAPRLSSNWSMAWHDCRPLQTPHPPFGLFIADHEPRPPLATIERPLTGAAFLRLMHEVTNSGDGRKIYSLITAALEDFPYYPKEAMFLIDLCKKNAATLTPVMRWRLFRYRSRLRSLLAGSTSDRVPYFLDDRKASIRKTLAA